MRYTGTLFAALLLLAATDVAQARVTTIIIDKVEPFADGAAFGDAGAYERVIGTVKGELDPQDPRNRGIVDLDKAPRNTRGMVEYDTDFFMLRPVDPAKASRKLLYEVNNRGRKFLLHWLMEAPAGPSNNEPRSLADAGNALVFQRGYTIVWSGWDPDAPKAGSGMTMRVPVAQEAGRPIVRKIRDELVNGTRGPMSETFKLSYEAASLDTKEAQLTTRAREADPERVMAADQWEFVDSRAIRLLPAGTKPEPGVLYELYYPAKDPKPLGIGFAATRDLVSFLRHAQKDDAGTQNPAGPIDATLAFGISQSGRYLRDFIGQGFNQDESARKVFDGVLAHISGVGRVFLNEQFGQPARTNTQHEDHLYPENAFPFSTAATEDPVTGKTGSLFRNNGFDPLLIEVNTSTEYWQKGASLLTTDPLGQRDLELPANARVFLVAGTQHAGRVGLKADRGPCGNPRNPHNPAPALRALLVDLDEWATKGAAPPASRVPRVADRTLVAPDETGFQAIPGASSPQGTNAIARFADWVHPKPTGGPQYRPLVPRVDPDGNEVAGILLPDIAAPLATYTGWNVYAAPFPAGEVCDRDGSFLPFAKDPAERTAKQDPRPSLAERYGSRDAYVAKVAAAAQALVRDRLLLPQDAERYVARAREAEGF
jgi:hypothetical protein